MTRPYPAPAAQSLQDFEPLLLAESILLRAAADGGIAKVGYQRPRTPAPDVRLRAEFLAFLARGGGPGAPVKGRRLQVLGACIIGTLDLRNATVPVSVWMYRCVFGAAPLFDGAHVQGSLSFPDTALPGFSGEAARVDGELAFNSGCNLYGELMLARARVGRDLNCERLRLRPSTKFPHTRPCRLVGDELRVGGDLLLSGGVEAVGELRLRSARIGGDLRASAIHLSAELDADESRGIALNLDRVDVRGNVWLDGFSAAGQVRMQRARIAGDLDCSGAEFDAIGDAGWGEDGGAVLLDRARVGGALILRGLKTPLQGASFVDARVGSLLDDASTWGQHYALDGFAYKRLAADAPIDAGMRVSWLEHQFAERVRNDHLPDPWRRLIKVLRRMGRDRHAADVAIGRERHLRRAGLIGRDAPAALRWLPRLGHDLYGLFVGYGHRPARLVAATLVLWLACAAAYWAAAEQGAMAPAAAATTADARTHAPLRPLVYSLDVLLPLLDLGQARRWAPVADAASNADDLFGPVPLVRALTWFEALCGWAAALTLVACLVGLGDRDRRR